MQSLYLPRQRVSDDFLGGFFDLAFGWMDIFSLSMKNAIQCYLVPRRYNLICNGSYTYNFLPNLVIWP